MTAFFISRVDIKDPATFQDYAKKAGESMKGFRGEILLKGTKFRQLAGEESLSLVAIVKFPNQKLLNEWFESKDYQSLIPLRDKAANMTIAAFNSASN